MNSQSSTRAAWSSSSSLLLQHPPLQHEFPAYNTTQDLHRYSHHHPSNMMNDDDSQATYTQHPGSYVGEGLITYAIQPSSGRASSSPKSLALSQTPRASPYPLPNGSRRSPESGMSATHQLRDGRNSPKQEYYYAPSAAELYSRTQTLSSSPSPGRDIGSSPTSGNHYPSSTGGSVPRLPPILQVEKQQVTTSATQLASASRRRNEAHFICPVPGCGSTFTRRFNLRGHLRSHTEERPYVCEWPGCGKGFARQHDCKRHQTLHTSKSQANVCQGCKKTFSRLDALNRHLRSEGGADCKQATEIHALAQQSRPQQRSTSGGASPTGSSASIRKMEDEWEQASNRSSGSAGRH